MLPAPRPFLFTVFSMVCDLSASYQPLPLSHPQGGASAGSDDNRAFTGGYRTFLFFSPFSQPSS
jgi:hypothetical protein